MQEQVKEIGRGQELPCGCSRKNGTSHDCAVADRLWAEVGSLYRIAASFEYGTVEGAEAWIAYLEKLLEYDRHIVNVEMIAHLTGELQEARVRLARYKDTK